MANKHILYISYDGMTDPLGQSQVLPYLVGLSRMGYHFSLVSCEKPDAFQRRKSVIEAICGENNIDWYPLPYTKRPPVLSTIIDLWRIISQCRKLLKISPYDIVHARGHYITSLAAMALLKHYRLKYVFDMRGFWADERVDGGLWSEKHPVYGMIYRYFKRKEIQFLNAADQIITLTERARNELNSWDDFKNKSLPIEVIPCCADLNHFDYNNISPEDKQALRAKYHIPQDALVLGYLGSFGTWYMIEEMVLQFKFILKVKPDSYFFVVSNDNPEHLSELLYKHDVPASRVVLTSAGRELVPLYLSVFDVGLFFIKPTFSKKGSSPVKHGEMMGMGIPLICNSGVGDVDSIVESSGTGYIIREFTNDAYHTVANHIDSIMTIDKRHIREQAFRYYNLESGVVKYADIYNKMLLH